ncbi:hypothetical protein C7N43_21820 [Sphingobacteriales bacterium UPWRP_1]|nr:hypothetical protein BVG80_16235 [Sphingobacteriales bacterium TSM_CSM]PSJ74870.1 hypothetical protein C7N43_21820 [Sphingobacteriales bacterium UPWRP_1]
MRDKSLKDQINDAISQIPQQLVVLESAIDPGLLKEYFEKSTEVAGLREEDAENVESLKDALFDELGDIEKKKIIMLLLAHTGSVTAYRILEEYGQVVQEPVLKKWMLLALQECRMFLESELLDETHGFILSGLGGSGNKLRYFFVVVAAEPNALTPFQQQRVESEFESICRQYHTQIEQVILNPDYVAFIALIPIDVTVNDFIDRGIEQSNELGNFLLTVYLITNMEIPTPEQLTEYIEQMRNSDGEMEETEYDEDDLF